VVWFKDNNPGHRFVAGLVAALAAIAPDDVLVPIAVDRERGRLLAEDHGATLTHAEVADQSIRYVVVQALARLQCRLLGRLDPAEYPSMIVLHPADAGAREREVGREWATLPPEHPMRIDAGLLERVQRAADVLDRRTSFLSDAIPLDVELNDIYPANIFSGRPNSTGVLRPRFFDLGNAIWGHPFVSLHGLLDAIVEWTCAPLLGADRDALVDAYLQVWADHLDSGLQVLRHDLDITAALVDVHRLVSWCRLVPHADATELRARGEIPRGYLNRIVRSAEDLA
jgi:hypothetical protein